MGRSTDREDWLISDLTDNVDYHEVKHIIKAKTSITQVKPLTIPGQGADIKECQDLENELYTKLCEEHDRANLFVKSKYWEIQKKLSMVTGPCHVKLC